MRSLGPCVYNNMLTQIGSDIPTFRRFDWITHGTWPEGVTSPTAENPCRPTLI